MKIVDRVFSCLLILGAIGHTAGSFLGYGSKPEVLLWSLGTSLFLFMLGAINFLRAGRPDDRPLGWITLVFNVCWILSALQFGHVIGNMSDPRVIGFSIVSMVLIGMSLRTMTLQKF